MLKALLVFIKNEGKTSYNDGKPLRALTTTYIRETWYNIQGNDLGHGKNVKDWEIRG